MARVWSSGGIEMARIVLRDTRDPKVCMMASKTITEQTREVGELNTWLRQHGKRPEQRIHPSARLGRRRGSA